jgi:hypothetical protein
VKKKAGRILQIVCYGVLIATAITALWAMTRHFDKPLLGPHSFRQTQTAISAFYMAQDPSMFLDYITPVLGPPWKIPMELPLYQWIVARWHNLTGMPLDPSGKLISIAAWVLCLAPLFAIGRSLRLPPEVLALTAAIALASPLYLFWGAAFLIETTGLLFALVMVACALRARMDGKFAWLALAVLFGSVAAMLKATTWAVASGTGILLVLFAHGLPKVSEWKRLTASVAALVLPLALGKLWLAYGDNLKQANPFAREIILANSEQQAAWNFGTWEQKFSLGTWEVILRHITDQILVPLPGIGALFLVLVLIAGAVFTPKRIPLILLFLAGFASGPIIFTNLYFEHSYYWCANGVWLLMAVSVALAGIWECHPQSAWPRVVAIAITGCIAISGFVTWSQRYLPILRALPTQEALADAWTKPVQTMVPAQRTLLIVGNDWNPNSLYYAQRKGIAFPTAKWIPFPGPQLEHSLAMLGPDEALGAVVVNPRLLEGQNQAFWNIFLRDKGFSTSGTSTAFGILFPALNLKFGDLR